jgi:hypothetical protein
MKRGTTWAALAAALALAGCGDPPARAVTKCDVAAPIAKPAQTDILFVVDDSGSMQPEQTNLATNFDAFITRLAASPVKNEFQIGVTTTSVDFPRYDTGSAGSFKVFTTYDGTPTGKPYPAGALVAAAGRPTILVATSPTLVDDFKANVNVGTSGSGKEQGFRAAQLALTDRIADGANAGFLRPGARLAIIVVTDEDDCSDPASPPAVIYPSSGDACHSDAEQAKLPAVADYVSKFKGAPLGGSVRDVVVAVIAAVDPVTKQPVAPVCSPGGYPAKRYSTFVSAFGSEGLIDDVCRADFRSTLAAIAGLVDPGQKMDLDQEPADPALLTVSVTRAQGATTSCTLALEGAANVAAADVVYHPPQSGLPPWLSFQGNCLLQQGDTVQLQILCAG